MTKSTKRLFNITHMQYASPLVPLAFDGFSIAHVSDVHNRRFMEGALHPASAIQEESPDIIAITGDLIDRHHPDIDMAMEFVHLIAEIAPVYFCPGNHEFRSEEYDKLVPLLTKAGVHMLDDASETIERNGAGITIAGLRDPAFFTESSGKTDKVTIHDRETELNRLISPGSFTILLSHRPELFPIYTRCRVSLVLSGHAHGGQVYLPGIGGVYAPGQGIFPKYTHGIHRQDDTAMIVSRGLGGQFYRLRPYNRPEIVIIKLLHG